MKSVKENVLEKVYTIRDMNKALKEKEKSVREDCEKDRADFQKSIDELINDRHALMDKLSRIRREVEKLEETSFHPAVYGYVLKKDVLKIINKESGKK